MKPIRLLLLALLLLPIAPRAFPDDKPAEKSEAIDWDKARSLHQREQKGEKLSADEQAYLDRAKEARRQMQKNGGDQQTAVGPPKESTGLVPLTQLKADAIYKGVDGGLYGHGQNQPPEKLLRAAMDAAAGTEPLDADGKPAGDGRIVLMSVGMSNTTMEFSRFKQLADASPDKSAKLLIVDAAQGGQDALKWDTTEPVSPWSTAAVRLAAARVTPRQVQAIWLKQALIAQGTYGEFPRHSDELKKHIESSIRIAQSRYPNLKLVYLSSRIYAGYARSQLNPEPYAYEGAFAIRSVIDDQLKSELKAPIILWGPYLWADGIKGREQDGLVWKPEDFAADGTHPSESGRQKVAELLLAFFKSDPTAKGWFGRAK